MIRVWVRFRDGASWELTPMKYAKLHYPAFSGLVRISRVALHAAVQTTDIEFVVVDADAGPFAILACVRPEDVDALLLLDEWVRPVVIPRVHMDELVTEEIWT